MDQKIHYLVHRWALKMTALQTVETSRTIYPDVRIFTVDFLKIHVKYWSVMSRSPNWSLPLPLLPLPLLPLLLLPLLLLLLLILPFRSARHRKFNLYECWYRMIKKSLCTWRSVFEQSPHNWWFEEYIRNVDRVILNTVFEKAVRRLNKYLETGGGEHTFSTLLLTFCIVINKCTETFWSPCIIIEERDKNSWTKTLCFENEDFNNT